MKKYIALLVFLISILVCTPVGAIDMKGGGDSLPKQTDHSGKFLTTDGTVASWGTPEGAGDVVGVGNCASGDCLDGSSDGGTYIRFYGGNIKPIPGNDLFY